MELFEVNGPVSLPCQQAQVNKFFLPLLVGKTGLCMTGLLVLNGYRSFGLSEHGERCAMNVVQQERYSRRNASLCKSELLNFSD
jgi:hypothetical protein